ncbi:hypothetical protein COLO4_01119 [Corchorus olitorius]|uniref:Uncharacterized protein n=1 Tax=Corchorus olitorius TaxID=93759 RepID=A0A1R3L2X9_9ROSI|nr:hypothetical protein COLO4_01119 [Corchorus olitorius]
MSILGFGGRRVVVQVARQVHALRHQEDHGHAQAAEHLEVHPEVLEGEGDEQVGRATEQEEGDPGQVETVPHGIRQGQGVAHDALDQHLVTDEVAAEEGQGEQPVDHRRLPLEEGLAVEGQGQAAEHQAGHQGQQLAFFQAALADEQGAVDHQRADDQHGRGAVDTPQLEVLAGELDQSRFGLVDDEKQQQRDEIDELFHSGSQERDVPA